MSTIQQQVLDLILTAKSSDNLSKAIALYRKHGHSDSYSSTTKFALLDFVTWLSVADDFEKIADIHFSHEKHIVTALQTVNHIYNTPEAGNCTLKEALKEPEIAQIIAQKFIANS